MPWKREIDRVPQRIRTVRVGLVVREADDGSKVYDARAEVAIVFDDGSIRERVIERLEDHLTAQQKTGARALMDALHQKAQTEIL